MLCAVKLINRVIFKVEDVLSNGISTLLFGSPDFKPDDYSSTTRIDPEG